MSAAGPDCCDRVERAPTSTTGARPRTGPSTAIRRGHPRWRRDRTRPPTPVTNHGRGAPGDGTPPIFQNHFLGCAVRLSHQRAADGRVGRHHPAAMGTPGRLRRTRAPLTSSGKFGSNLPRPGDASSRGAGIIGRLSGQLAGVLGGKHPGKPRCRTTGLPPRPPATTKPGPSLPAGDGRGSGHHFRSPHPIRRTPPPPRPSRPPPSPTRGGRFVPRWPPAGVRVTSPASAR